MCGTVRGCDAKPGAGATLVRPLSGFFVARCPLQRPAQTAFTLVNNLLRNLKYLKDGHSQRPSCFIYRRN